MKVVYTDDALRDRDEILTYIAANYPTAYAPFEKRLHTAVARIGAWPESAAEVCERMKRDGGSVSPAHANTDDPNGPLEAFPLMIPAARTDDSWGFPNR